MEKEIREYEWNEEVQEPLEPIEPIDDPPTEQPKIYDESEPEPKPKKRILNGIIIFFIIVCIIILAIRLDSFLDDSSIPITKSERIFFFVTAFVVIALVVLFIALPKRFKIYAVAWIKCFFIYFVWPSMLLIIVLLGALEQKYPSEYGQVMEDGNITKPFSENLNNSLSTASGALIKAFERGILTFYDLGQEHPDFWIFLIIMFVIISLMAMGGIVRNEIEDMKHKDIIENAIKEYYEKVEQEELLTKPKTFLKNRSSWLLLGLVILTAIIGLWLWFR